MKQLILFDLDGTLTESRYPMDEEMGHLFKSLLEDRYVAVVSGSSCDSLCKQVRIGKYGKDNVPCGEAGLSHLHLFPSSSTEYDRIQPDGTFVEIYKEKLRPEEKRKLKTCTYMVLKDLGFRQAQIDEVNFTDSGGQITFSLLYNGTPLEDRKAFDPERKIRQKVKRALDAYLSSEYEVRIGCNTTIDITRKGQNKGRCVGELASSLGISRGEMVFYGDGLYEGGNDEVMLSTGIRCVQVSGPEDTKLIIKQLLIERADGFIATASG